MTKSQADLLSIFCYQTSSLSVPPVVSMDMPVRTVRGNRTSLYGERRRRWVKYVSGQAPLPLVRPRDGDDSDVRISRGGIVLSGTMGKTSIKRMEAAAAKAASARWPSNTPLAPL